MRIINVCMCFGLFVMLACVLVPGNALAQGGGINPPCCFQGNGAEFEAFTITSSAQSPELMQETGPLPGSFDGPWAEPEALPVFEPMPADDPAREPVLPYSVSINPEWNRNNLHKPLL